MTVTIDDAATNRGGHGRASLSAPPRILPRPAATSWRDHRSRFGPLPLRPDKSLIAEVAAAGLLGRGGAGFPTSRKMSAVDAARRGWRRGNAVVVANGSESEPASAKDKVLLRVSPHLVLDGMVAAAVALGADRAVVCVDRRDREAVSGVRRALDERRGCDPVALSVAAAPSRYVASQETALIAWLNGGDAKPGFVPPLPALRGVGGEPTLVDNVETLANIGLIARIGATKWRSVGAPDEPGTTLVTVIGAVHSPGVYEIETGTPLRSLLANAGAGPSSGVLVGGYFGTWLTPDEAGRAALSRSGLRPFGASPGCGVVAVLGEDACPLAEAAAVTAWLAANSAQQCGPCHNGLPAIAGAFRQLVAGDADGSAAAKLDRWSPMVVGRGACKLPDGTVGFVDSARRAFAAHIELHRHRGPCPPRSRSVLPTPSLGGWR